MADDSGNGEPQQEYKKFFVDRAKSNRSTCKKCKQKLESGTLRLAKSGYNPFGPGPMKLWHHVNCMFDVFASQRRTTARIETPEDIEGWSDLEEEDQQEILKYLPDCKGWKPKPKSPSKDASTKPKAEKTPKNKNKEKEKKYSAAPAKEPHKDDSFRQFRRLCATLSDTDSYTGKTAHVREFFTKGTDGSDFKGDLHLWCRLLLPGVVKRVYNLQSKQLIKLFSKIFHTDHDDMLEHLEQGDVAETVKVFFEKSQHVQPTKKSALSLQDVDKFLEELSGMTKEDEQSYHFKQMAKLCTSNDLKMIIRLVKHDLRINAGPKHILEAVHPDAYQAFQTSRDLDTVLSKAVGSTDEGCSSLTKQTALTITASLMTPVLPMLAEACKSVEHAMKKCPNGMYSEIKYDGERVQVHKKGNEFRYFSRSLKPVLPHKVNMFKDYIPEAFPHGRDLILDSEVLLIDVKTGKPLPFGSLGIHKKNAFQDANVCLFVFDCIYYNGEVLLGKPVKERRRILEQNMKEVPNHVMFSEMEEIHDPKDLENMITKVLRLGLEGLVLKDLMSIYEPGKRHWLKVKKDYLYGGAMADSADLVVLGAWFGTGQKGGMMSVFLMGCYNPDNQKWCTVTKVHTGHDDKTLERLQEELDMIKISKEASKLPDWLLCTKTMIPDFVARDPKSMPVWEITGAEFTQHDVHTAAGISIRFPRVTKIRDDKMWKTATSLPELKDLFKMSKEHNVSLPSTSHLKHIHETSNKGADSENSSTSSPEKGSVCPANSNTISKIKSSEDAEGGTKHTPKKHKRKTSSKESSGSAAGGNNGEDEDDDEASPAKRKKKEPQQYTLKKVC
ncbi:hypothetical protein Cfor_02993 [Coptotermes formosanus]|uniref:DNA ligase n=1 Tax=Coptotermes formosanus TaxID=36987 RepID=A0A6L2P8U3_COPFO|nr:hypothetical protein Cfor_02993 [Coptotermes formosanus]